MTTDLLTFGEAMASLRHDSLLRLGGELTLSVAGAESNVAIAAARLGHRVRWVGRVGDDEFGALLLRVLRAEHVDVTHAVTVPGQPTGLIFFERAPGGRTRVHYRRSGSAATGLVPSDLESALGDGVRIVHLTGITPALGDAVAATVRHTVEAARSAGATVCLDVNYRQQLWDRHTAARALRPLIHFIDVLVASEEELPLMVDGPDENGRAKTLLAVGVREVIVKRGALGATLYTVDDRIDGPAVEVPVIDTVGAGDAFTAGYLSGLLDGLPVTDRLHRANTLGAAAVAAIGDWEGLPTRAELEQVGRTQGDVQR